MEADTILHEDSPPGKEESPYPVSSAASVTLTWLCVSQFILNREGLITGLGINGWIRMVSLCVNPALDRVLLIDREE